MSEDAEIVEAFLEESRENLTQLDVDPVALEAQPNDAELLGRIFRAIHTIKGTCGFLGLPKLEGLTHAGESLLGALRKGDIDLDASVTTSLLRLVDTIRALLAHIESTEQESDDAHADLISELAAHMERLDKDSGTEATPVAHHVEPPPPFEPRRAILPEASESSVRVEVAVLDKLMDLVGELVLARSRLVEFERRDEAELAAPHRQLRSITKELQSAVMESRLQPVGIVLGRFHRIVRDLAAALGKTVRLEIDGEDVGVDKAVNEVLRDPLLHLVRNAVDHGLERPSEREAAGKPHEGLLRIRAYHEGGMVHVEVGDDGRGIDTERLLASAISAGLLDRTRAEELDQRQIFELMFHPGLSTATEVTSVSGRGVGMDVVRSNVKKVGGSIEIRSDPGAGTTFRLNVPLTLAIMPVLLVSCGASHYAVPAVHVREVVQEGEANEVGGTRLYRWRGHLLPLAELSELLGGVRSGSTVVVVEVDDLRFGIVVDAVGDTTEAVVKPLTRAIRDISLFGAVTILPDGRPALILDLSGLAVAAGVQPVEDPAEPATEADLPAANDLLVALGHDGGRLALSLRHVRRLERLSETMVEQAGDIEMVHYRDTLVPLLRVDELLRDRRMVARLVTKRPDDGLLRAIVCESSVGAVAVVVFGVEDIAPEPTTPTQPASRAGVEACLVVNGHIAELLDLEALVTTAGLAPRG